MVTLFIHLQTETRVLDKYVRHSMLYTATDDPNTDMSKLSSYMFRKVGIFSMVCQVSMLCLSFAFPATNVSALTLQQHQRCDVERNS